MKLRSHHGPAEIRMYRNVVYIVVYNRNSRNLEVEVGGLGTHLELYKTVSKINQLINNISMNEGNPFKQTNKT